MLFVRNSLLIITGLILVSVHHLSAQQKMTDYTSLWKKIDSLINKKGLTQSALAEVNKLYAFAKKENQDAQVIKALIYRTSLQENTEEQADNKTVKALEDEINTAAEPAKSILNSLLAEKYLNYFQQHRYQLYDRTNTTTRNKQDIATWSADDLHATISALYLASLDNQKLLQQTKLEPYDAIIVKGNARYLRPTLYDLLAHRALDYFKNSERDISKASYAFEVDNPAYFSAADGFAKLVIRTADSTSLYHKALLIYQQLLIFHTNDEKPDALIDADIDRLQFVQSYGVMEAKDSLYEKALNTITSKFPNLPAAAQAYYLVAELHAGKADQYRPLTTDEKDAVKGDYMIAANICKQILQQKVESEGKANCFNLLQRIEKKELNLTTEKVNLPQQPFRTLVSYRNFSKLYFRVIQLSDEDKKNLVNRYDDNYWNKLVNLKALRNWNQDLPATIDYHKHNAEIKIDALPVGQYLLLASTNADFTFAKNPLAAQYFYVSAISYINNNQDYFILNRETGQPLAGATVQAWWTEYDYNTRNNKKVKAETQVADKNGWLRLSKKPGNQQRNLQLEISITGDRLFMDEPQYIYYREEDSGTPQLNASQFEKEKARVFLFTDRSIYRPGQTVYFKGIAVTNDFTTKKIKVYSGVSTKIFLRDANGEDVDSMELKTNEYGSYSGKFVLPQGVLNGAFSVADETLDGTQEISVEEYKRPKFAVEYDTLKGSYKVNDSIAITGLAKAYAGNNIDGAQVKYRVQRVARFIYPWLYWKWGYPRTRDMEIAHGVATTNADGKFTITFKAIPDLSIRKELEPVFDYRVSADVTDINGETRSGTTVVSVSYKALQVSIDLSDEESIDADSLKNISISTKNIAGTPEPATVTLTISRLQAPDRLIRKRYWQQPDQFVMSKEEYIKLFPHDEYKDETDFRSWAKEKPLISITDSSNNNSKFNIQNIKFQDGWYAVEAITKDKYGAEVKDTRYVQLYHQQSKTLPAQLYTWSSEKNTSPEPAETATISIGSAAKDIFLIQEIDKTKPDAVNPGGKGETKTPVYNFIALNGKQSFSFPVTEEDRGGFGVNHFFVKDNRFYIMSNAVNVPWTNKELTINYETFRDKTLPGSEEKWKLTIAGFKKEKVAAEMLASMYDASLDQFKPHSWTVPGIWPTFGGNSQWDSRYAFTQVQSQERYWNEEYKSFAKSYDQLFQNNLVVRRQMRMAAGNRKADINSAFLEVDIAPAPEQAKASVAAAISRSRASAAEKNNDTDGDGVATNFSMPMVVIGKKDPIPADVPVQIRKNFNETAFFFPDLKTDSAGNISFGFTIPEALTKWKFQALAHTKDLAFGYSSKEIITQKQLMVQPNAPRFMREGDKMEFSAKIVNLTDKELTGTAQLELLNTATNQPVDGWFRNMYPTQYFTAAAGQSTPVKFSIDVPYQYNSAVSYRLIAKAGNNSDGEEAAMPVLTNSMLVTESMPLPMRGNTAKNFRFEKLLQSGNSETLQHHALTVEFTTNPAWYAVQALPYLMDFPYECAEQTFNRYYANALAAKIANSSPRIKEIFEKWKTADTAALLSNLQKNPELKAVLLEETPWVIQAKNEAQQKKNIALLFDMVKMGTALASSFQKLQQLQSENGGFVWFKGGADDRFMTQYIITGLGHLMKLKAFNASQEKDWATLASRAVAYLDARIKEDYDYLVKHKTDLSKNNLGYLQVQYLYMRSFFGYNIPGNSFTAINYYRKQSQQFWLQQNRYMQGMIALSLTRTGDVKTAGDIVKSLRQNAIVNDEMGMYWKDNSGGYFWHQAPVETQSLLIEVFTEVAKDTKAVNDLKTWLLKQKQTQNWKTTKATADACYALLLQGSDWLNTTPVVEIKLGDKSLTSDRSLSSPLGGGREGAEAATGYFKQTIDGPFVKPAMGEISVKISSAQSQSSLPAWGAVYWQYFEHLDKITSAATPLQLTKQLFVEKNTDRGPVLEPITENAYLKVGDKIKVRIELHADRDMEYVHMKDMRASCMEPVNVLSGYKWQGGLGYYESTKDASTNFFFGWLPKGTYVFEYPLFVTHTGNFSNGVTSIQCMYAPEFASHSEGVRVNVEGK